MSAAAPGRHPRRGSEKRLRQRQVHVRFSDAEYHAVTDAVARTGKPAGQLLREVFLMADNHTLLPDLVGEEATSGD